jgi:glutaredoxin
MHVTVYSKPGCHLCEDALDSIDRLTPQYGLDVTEVNILEDMAVYEQYRDIIPVVEATDAQVGRLVVPFSEADLGAYFEKARRATGDNRANAAQSDPDSWLDKMARKVGWR